MSRITIVPTSHVAGESIERIKRAIREEKPDCVAVEMDVNRYRALKKEHQAPWQETMASLGIFTFLLYWIMKRLQLFFGKKTGIIPGTEMLAAVEAARREGTTVAFIDQDIQLTFLGIRNMETREKVKLLRLLVMAVLGLAFPFLPGKKEKIDLNRVPGDRMVREAMKVFRKEMPGLYRVLVENRDRFMGRNLIALTDKFERIVCVAGAGHREGLERIVRDHLAG